jgi:type VI secretion system secreted protein VgrG
VIVRPSDQAILWTWASTEPFGQTLATNPNSATLGAYTYNPRFPGQVFDAEAGWFYNVNRDYNPAVGRYVQSDPIGLAAGSMSTYLYSGGSPLSTFDMYGLQATLPGMLGGAPVPAEAMPGTPQNQRLVTKTYNALDAVRSTIVNKTDKGGNKICPRSDQMPPPGDCSYKDQQELQRQIDRICSLPRKCYTGMDKTEAIARAEINRACAVARDTLNNKCFAGGDETHRNMAIDAFGSAAECYRVSIKP